MKGTVKKLNRQVIFKIFIIGLSLITILITIFITTVFILGIVGIFKRPMLYENPEDIIPSIEVYGNSPMNLASRGFACKWSDNYVLATSNGIEVFSSDLSKLKKISEKPVLWLNVVDNNLYYEDYYNVIYQFDLISFEEKRIFKPRLFTINDFHIVGDKLYYFKWRALSHIGCIDLNNYKRRRLNIKEKIENIGGYRSGYFYFSDSSNVYEYDLLENRYIELKVDIEDSIKSIFIKDNLLFILDKIYYDDSNDKYNVLIYNFDDEKITRRINLPVKGKKHVSNVIVIKDKIVYEDNENAYILNMNNQELLEISADGNCIDVYALDNYIAALYTNDVNMWYVFYDEYGNEIGTIKSDTNVK